MLVQCRWIYITRQKYNNCIKFRTRLSISHYELQICTIPQCNLAVQLENQDEMFVDNKVSILKLKLNQTNVLALKSLYFGKFLENYLTQLWYMLQLFFMVQTSDDYFLL